MRKEEKEKRGRKVKSYPEMHQTGHLSVERPLLRGLKECDFGVQIAEDGRVWVCIDGEAFLRFSPII